MPASAGAGRWRALVTEGNAGPQMELEDLLRRVETSREDLLDALKSTDGAVFERANKEGESIKSALERTTDELNFYYGRLAARALNLPQPPCMQKAEFHSLREATLSIQVAHRRFSNLLHDLVPADLSRTAQTEDGAEYTLRQVLEMAAAHYRRRLTQVRSLASPKRRRRS
jgi:flagellar biosynthesis GTPase FlhF